MNAAEYEESFQVDGDLSLAARDALTKLLVTVLGDLQAAAECIGVGDSDTAVEPGHDWMVRALVADAIEQIDVQNAAHALLVDTGKWNPETDIPAAE
jgi:hypothetical protein